MDGVPFSGGCLAYSKTGGEDSRIGAKRAKLRQNMRRDGVCMVRDFDALAIGSGVKELQTMAFSMQRMVEISFAPLVSP